MLNKVEEVVADRKKKFLKRHIMVVRMNWETTPTPILMLVVLAKVFGFTDLESKLL